MPPNVRYVPSRSTSLLVYAPPTATFPFTFGIAYSHRPSSLSICFARRVSIPNSPHGRKSTVLSTSTERRLHLPGLVSSFTSPQPCVRPGPPTPSKVGTLALHRSTTGATPSGPTPPRPNASPTLSHGSRLKSTCLLPPPSNLPPPRHKISLQLTLRLL